MSNSKLVSYTLLSPNHYDLRSHAIDRITPHCVVGQAKAERICEIFQPVSRNASCNYGIGWDGRISLCVEECNGSWCSSSKENDMRAVTIECASDAAAPYTMTDAVYQSLVILCADICTRNGKTKIVWIPEKEKALAYTPAVDEMQFTVHRWFANKSCPGDWLFNRMQQLADDVNTKLAAARAQEKGILYRVQVGAFRNKVYAEQYLKKIRAAGFPDAYIVEVK